MCHKQKFAPASQLPVSVQATRFSESTEGEKLTSSSEDGEVTSLAEKSLSQLDIAVAGIGLAMR
jgi:hypothetical protein